MKKINFFYKFSHLKATLGPRALMESELPGVHWRINSSDLKNSLELQALESGVVGANQCLQAPELWVAGANQCFMVLAGTGVMNCWCLSMLFGACRHQSYELLVMLCGACRHRSHELLVLINALWCLQAPGESQLPSATRTVWECHKNRGWEFTKFKNSPVSWALGNHAIIWESNLKNLCKNLIK